MTQSHTRRHRRGLLGALTATAVLLSAVGCTSDSATEQGSTTAASQSAQSSTTAATSENNNQGQWPRTVDTDDGEVTIEAKPERIVSTSVTLTGTLLAIDAPVIASGATRPNNRVSDDQGFFTQWSDVAKERGVEAIYNVDPSTEAILAQKPDLVVVSATGADSALNLVDQLRGVVPTVVVDYGNKDWQGIATMLGQATGQEQKAQEVIDNFDAHVAQVKQSITLPAQPVNSLVYREDGSGANIWTKDAAQNRLLASLGFTIADIPESVKGGDAQGKRHDIVTLSAENLPVALNGETVFLINADEDTKQAFLANPSLASTPAVASDSVYQLGLDSFRLDYYSSTKMVERIEELFAK